MSCRTEVPTATMNLINEIAPALGYTAKRFDAQLSRWKLVNKLLSYASEHPSLFQQ